MLTIIIMLTTCEMIMCGRVRTCAKNYTTIHMCYSACTGLLIFHLIAEGRRLKVCVVGNMEVAWACTC